MRKFLIAFLILVGVLLTILLLMQRSRPHQQQVIQQPAPTETEPEAMPFPEPPPGAIVFDMKYQGLSGKQDELRYNSYWGFGGSASETPFLADLKKKIKDFETVYNPNFVGAEWSAVEIKDKKAVALYVDLDADGKVSDNEKILPIQNSESSSNDRTEFVTPDFLMITHTDRQVPFRALLQVAFYGQDSQPNFMWSPSCILEGTSTINGQSAKLILFTNGFTGSFKDFGRSSFSLQTGKEETGSYISRDMLSSIINHNGQFYNIKLNGIHEIGGTIRAILTEYTGDTGNLTTQLTGNTNLEAKLSSANIAGSKDTTVQFNLASEQAKLPTGSYKLNRGYINYSARNGDNWRLDFQEGPEFTIDADKTCNVELGKPVLSISAVEENKRYQSDVKEQTVYPEGTNIYISRIIKGKGGELYGRFSQLNESSRNYNAIEPELKIVDSEGKEVAATKIKYG